MSARKPRVSIGLPVYNGERYIAETIDSHLAQTFQDFELIICDNASTDRTEQICRENAARDTRIRYVRNPGNLGAAANYRLAFELSSAEYFRWNPSDDLCGPEFLARCVELLDREPSVVLAYPKTKLIDERGQVISEYEDCLRVESNRASDRFVQLLQNLRLCNALYGLIRANVLRRTALLRNFIGGDIPLLAELALYGEFREIPEFLFFRRFHAQASSSMEKEDQVLEFYDPKRKGKTPLTAWRHLHAHFCSVRRAPLDLSEKLRLFGYIARMGVWSRGRLAGELSAAVRQKLHSALEA